MKATLDKHGQKKILEKVPLKRLTNDADMAGAAIYLASRASAYVTGVVLPVDGGTGYGALTQPRSCPLLNVKAGSNIASIAPSTTRPGSRQSAPVTSCRSQSFQAQQEK